MSLPIPYWSGDGVTLYHGRCEDILPHIPLDSVDALVTDPPYFQVKDDDWDNQWAKVDEFIAWLAGVTDQIKPTLRAHASVWMFASPALTSTVERMLAERFRILNSVRWVKDAGWHMRISEVAARRRLLIAWEGILFAEQISDEYASFDYENRKGVFVEVGRHLSAARIHAGLTRSDVAPHILCLYRNFDTATSMLSDWEIGKSYVSPEAYAIMRQLYGSHLLREHADLRREYDDLRREYEDLRREYEDLRRPFTLPERGPSTDIWNFPVVRPYPGKHPCEKPQGMIRHMIEMSSRPNGVILDPFAGSGSTLLAARDLGRQAIGIEQDMHWCEHAARKLNQTVLNFDEAF